MVNTCGRCGTPSVAGSRWACAAGAKTTAQRSAARTTPTLLELLVVRLLPDVDRTRCPPGRRWGRAATASRRSRPRRSDPASGSRTPASDARRPWRLPTTLPRPTRQRSPEWGETPPDRVQAKRASSGSSDANSASIEKVGAASTRDAPCSSTRPERVAVSRIMVMALGSRGGNPGARAIEAGK